MGATYGATRWAIPPDDVRKEKAGETRSARSVEPPARDSANAILRLLTPEDQESSEQLKEVRFRFVDLRDDSQRRTEAARQATADAELFARTCVEAAALGLAMDSRGGATQAKIVGLLFVGADLVDAVLRDLTERSLLKPRVREIGKPLYWIPRNQLACRAERRRLKQLLIDLGAEVREGGHE